MCVEIRFVSYGENNEILLSHIGEGYSKEECLKLIGPGPIGDYGVFEYIVHKHDITIYTSTPDQLGVEKVLDRIFDK